MKFDKVIHDNGIVSRFVGVSKENLSTENKEKLNKMKKILRNATVLMDKERTESNLLDTSIYMYISMDVNDGILSDTLSDVDYKTMMDILKSSVRRLMVFNTVQCKKNKINKSKEEIVTDILNEISYVFLEDILK
jgi:hypothetical protein